LFNPRIGEIFLCSEETSGKFVAQHELNGHYIVNFGGGYDQLFTIEDCELKRKSPGS